MLSRWAEIAWSVNDSPGAERSGDIIPVGATPALGPPSLLYNGYRVIPGGKAARVWR